MLPLQKRADGTERLRSTGTEDNAFTLRQEAEVSVRNSGTDVQYMRGSS